MQIQEIMKKKNYISSQCMILTKNKNLDFFNSSIESLSIFYFEVEWILEEKKKNSINPLNKFQFFPTKCRNVEYPNLLIRAFFVVILYFSILLEAGIYDGKREKKKSVGLLVNRHIWFFPQKKTIIS